MVNKDKTGGNRQTRLREARAKWLKENAYGLSAEGLIGALVRGECSLSWASVPTQRAADAATPSEVGAVLHNQTSGERGGLA